MAFLAANYNNKIIITKTEILSIGLDFNTFS
jgi:hypothetical protein